MELSNQTSTTLQTAAANISLKGAAATAQVNSIINAEFIAAVFNKLHEGAHAAVCSKPGDPTTGGWLAKPADRYFTDLS